MSVSQADIKVAKDHVSKKYEKMWNEETKGTRKKSWSGLSDSQKQEYIKEYEDKYYGGARQDSLLYEDDPIQAYKDENDTNDSTSIERHITNQVNAVNKAKQQYNDKTERNKAAMDNKVKSGDSDFSEDTLSSQISRLKGEGNEIPAYDQGQATDQTEPQVNYSDLYREYGNNFFELTTFDRYLNGGQGGYYTLAGVLKEVPSFSMSTTWEKGPASTISDTVKGFMCSSLMEMVTTLGGHDRAWMNLDEGTDRTYASSSRPSFSLTFKLYTNDNIGSQQLSTWKTWLRALSIYATPSVDAKVNISTMAENAVVGLINNIDTLNAATDGFKEGFKNDENVTAADKKNAFERAVNAIESAANKVTSHIAKRDGPKRVETTANSENFYGAKIWYLRILPGIFKKPLIVYISNWGVTYSKEMNLITQEPIWIEFKITCEMDQIASAPVWLNYLT